MLANFLWENLPNPLTFPWISHINVHHTLESMSQTTCKRRLAGAHPILTGVFREVTDPRKIQNLSLMSF